MAGRSSSSAIGRSTRRASSPQRRTSSSAISSGGFAGGPIKRNSTFFFAGWQRTRITNRASELIRFVPTAAQRQGDFSNCTPACPQLYNPATGLPFPNNQIPSNLWDPSAVKVFAALPTSTLPNGQVTVPRATGQDSNQFVGKVDQQLGANNQLSARYSIDDFNNASQFLPENILSYTGPSLESIRAARASSPAGSGR